MFQGAYRRDCLTSWENAQGLLRGGGYKLPPLSLVGPLYKAWTLLVRTSQPVDMSVDQISSELLLWLQFREQIHCTLCFHVSFVLQITLPIIFPIWLSCFCLHVSTQSSREAEKRIVRKREVLGCKFNVIFSILDY